MSFPYDVTSLTFQIPPSYFALQKFGPPALVCLNAGINPELAHIGNEAHARERVLSNYLADEADTDACANLKETPALVVDVNVQTVIYGIKLTVRSISTHSSTGTCIIITGFKASHVGLPYQELYVVSKHAILDLVRASSQRPELVERQIALGMVALWLTLRPIVNDFLLYNTSQAS